MKKRWAVALGAAWFGAQLLLMLAPIRPPEDALDASRPGSRFVEEPAPPPEPAHSLPALDYMAAQENEFRGAGGTLAILHRSTQRQTALPERWIPPPIGR